MTGLVLQMALVNNWFLTMTIMFFQNFVILTRQKSHEMKIPVQKGENLIEKFFNKQTRN